jgi:hypothetical protein
MFTKLAPGWLIDADGEPHALLDDTDLVGSDVQLAELSGHVENTSLGNNLVPMLQNFFFVSFVIYSFFSLIQTHIILAMNTKERKYICKTFY